MWITWKMWSLISTLTFACRCFCRFWLAWWAFPGTNRELASCVWKMTFLFRFLACPAVLGEWFSCSLRVIFISLTATFCYNTEKSVILPPDNCLNQPNKWANYGLTKNIKKKISIYKRFHIILSSYHKSWNTNATSLVLKHF